MPNNLCVSIALFRIACSNGDLAKAQYIYQNTSIIYQNNLIDKYVFTKACKRGHLDVCKWLIGIDNTILPDPIIIFDAVCKNGHADVAKWVWSIYGNIPYVDRIFINTCLTGRTNILKWFIEIGYTPREYIDFGIPLKPFKPDIKDMLISNNMIDPNMLISNERRYYLKKYT
jgi:hypothetical protein